MTALGVTGIGLVSPAGTNAVEHAMLLRAAAAPFTPSPYLAPDGDAIPVRYCPWIGAHAPFGERIVAMSAAAVAEAIGANAARPDELIACLPEGPWSAAERDAASAELKRVSGANVVHTATGSLSAVLDAASQRLATAASVLVVAAGSLLVPEVIRERVRRPRAPWQRPEPPPGEGAAALWLRKAGDDTGVLATIAGFARASGAARDDNQEIADGVGMTEALRSLPALGPIRLVCGQMLVDELRENEWLLALARTASLFDHEHGAHCLETEIGRVPGASGWLSLAYGIALLRHGATARPEAPGAPLLVWAIDADGTRCTCLATVS